MICSKTGAEIVFQTAHVYPADLYRCPGCGSVVGNCSINAHNDNDVLTIESLADKTREIIQMPQGAQ